MVVKQKSILFLSALDFKEKSIQVIRKTPEAYAGAGWHVEYIVSRDISRYGNYFYEEEIDPPGVTVHRFQRPFAGLLDRINNHTLRTVIAKISGYVTVVKLALKGSSLLKSGSFDVIYGYEIHGVLAVWLLRIFRRVKYHKVVHRFQGTWCYEYLKNRKILKLIMNWESCLALLLGSDLCIMTNDGTFGDTALKMLHTRSTNVKFWINGVDTFSMEKKKTDRIKNDLHIQAHCSVAVTTCRLEQWKRVDRAILAIASAVNRYDAKDLLYVIVGDGSMRGELEALVREEDIEDNVIFAGAVSGSEISSYLALADFFLSTNDLSNVGNPLLEAIRACKIIFTLNNGDTGSWIQHRVNGFIYDIDDMLFENMANDIYEVINNESLRKRIISNIKKTEKEKLWTWKERFEAEIKEVEKLIAT